MAGCAVVVVLASLVSADEPLEPLQAIRLPAWVEASASTRVQPATHVSAPRPKSPADLAPLLEQHAPALSPTPIQQEASAGRLVRQLQHAASEARTAHALTRLIQRYQRARPQVIAEGLPRLLERLDRLASWAYASRGKLRATEARRFDAIEDFRASLVLDTSNHAARHALAVSLAEAGQTDQALDEFTKVIRARPDSSEARRNRAAVHLGRSELSEAVADCDAALRTLPADSLGRAATLRLRGAALHAAGRLRDAASDFNEAIRIDSGDAAALAARGAIFAEGGFYDQAAADYEAALHADPSYAEAYRGLAWLLATCPEPRIRNAATAVEASWRARRLGGADDFLTLEASAAAHAAAGDFGEAIRLQQRALLAAGDQVGTDSETRLRIYEAGRPFVAASGR